MRYDDPGAFYDAPNAFYDLPEDSAPTSRKKHPMSKPKLNLQSRSPLEKVQKTEDIVTALTANASFPTPIPSLATMTGKADALSAAVSAREAAKMAFDEALTNLNTAEVDLDTSLTQLMAYVESASGGDEAKILSAGFEIKGKPSPVGAMPQVQGLDSSAGDAEGRIILRWKSVKGAKTYEIQTCPDPITAAGWKSAGLTTKASLTLDGLPTGGRCWFRVRAIGSAGPGPWSDPCVKTVP
jgi:hypothetical protein